VNFGATYLNFGAKYLKLSAKYLKFDVKVSNFVYSIGGGLVGPQGLVSTKHHEVWEETRPACPNLIRQAH